MTTPTPPPPCPRPRPECRQLLCALLSYSRLPGKPEAGSGNLELGCLAVPQICCDLGFLRPEVQIYFPLPISDAGREGQKGVSRGDTSPGWIRSPSPLAAGRADPTGPYILGNLAIADGDWKFKIVPFHLLDCVTLLTLKHTLRPSLPILVSPAS